MGRTRQRRTHPKEVVRVDPGETVRIVVRFDDYTWKYPRHCHVLEDEEHAMMRQFEVSCDDECEVD